MFIPFLAAPIGWFNGTKGLSSITVQRKKHSLTGTGKAICNHNSSYLLIFYLKHSDVNSIVPCQQPWGKVHSETKTNFLRAGKSDGRHRDKLLGGTRCMQELNLHTQAHAKLSPRTPLQPRAQPLYCNQTAVEDGREMKFNKVVILYSTSDLEACFTI